MNRVDWMLTILAASTVLGVVILWRRQRDAMVAFNLFDLIMEGGKVSKIAFSYMVVLAVTTWIVIYLTIRDKMTEGIFLAYGGLWVTPLVARMVSNKSDPPTNTSTTTSTVVQQTTEVLEPKL
ncbi:MAG: hypothetical protein V4641_16375 [Pseudomonadota bacterium]